MKLRSSQIASWSTVFLMDELAARLRPEVTLWAKALNHDVDKATSRFGRNIDSFKEHLMKRRAFY